MKKLAMAVLVVFCIACFSSCSKETPEEQSQRRIKEVLKKPRSEEAERAWYLEQRIEELQKENAALREENERLRLQK